MYDYNINFVISNFFSRLFMKRMPTCNLYNTIFNFFILSFGIYGH